MRINSRPLCYHSCSSFSIVPLLVSMNRSNPHNPRMEKYKINYVIYLEIVLYRCGSFPSVRLDTKFDHLDLSTGEHSRSQGFVRRSAKQRLLRIIHVSTVRGLKRGSRGGAQFVFHKYNHFGSCQISA